MGCTAAQRRFDHFSRRRPARLDTAGGGETRAFALFFQGGLIDGLSAATFIQEECKNEQFREKNARD
ncbi:hypothetical protein D3C84_504730 [compost metagenome]